MNQPPLITTIPSTIHAAELRRFVLGCRPVLLFIKWVCRVRVYQKFNGHTQACDRLTAVLAAYKIFTIALFGVGIFVGANGCLAQTKKASDNLRPQIPEWVPIYPGTVVTEIKSNPGSIEHYASFKLISHDPCPKIIDWYEHQLTAAGYKTFARVDHDNGGCTSSVRSDSGNRSRSIYVSASHEVNDVEISVESVERGGSGSNVGLPSWIPIYKGSKLGEIEASKEPPGTHYHFSFTSRDDAAVIYPWYESQLSRLVFKCTFQTTPNSAGSFDGTASGRTFAIRNYPTPPDYTFVVDVTDR